MTRGMRRVWSRRRAGAARVVLAGVIVAAAGGAHLGDLGVARASEGGAARHAFSRALMGTEFRIVIHSVPADSAVARRAAEAAFARIAELERVLSDYDPESELSRLSATAGHGRPVPVSDDLWTVLSTAEEWSERTGGAFDVTVGSLTRLWRRAARRGSVPAPEEVEAARGSVGHDGLDLDPARRTVHLEDRGMRLDMGGIGKGYAADAALDHLRALGFPATLVDAGGDVVAGAPPPGEDGWRVELPPGSPGSCVMTLAHAAMATSGDRERSVEVDGVRHSHVLDPRTGASLTHGRVVTVLAPTATEADVLASALSVLSPGEGRALLRGTPGVAARILEPDGGSWRGPTRAHRARLRFPNCAPDHES